MPNSARPGKSSPLVTGTFFAALAFDASRNFSRGLPGFCVGSSSPVLSSSARSPKLCGGNSTIRTAPAWEFLRTNLGWPGVVKSRRRFSKMKSQTSKSSGRRHETRNSASLCVLPISAQIRPKSASGCLWPTDAVNWFAGSWTIAAAVFFAFRLVGVASPRLRCLVAAFLPRLEPGTFFVAIVSPSCLLRKATSALERAGWSRYSAD